MSFLQPILLLGLPLAALPIIIHLINQRRYQTVRWGAMMFLLAANKMSRGYARIRQWLIMAARITAIAVLFFAVSRPLAGGWVGLTAGGRAGTTLVLLDRSPSMRQGGSGASGSKLDSGIRQLVQTFKTIGSGRWVMIESATNKPRELESADALLNSPAAEPVSASSDIPGMLQAARDFIRDNKAGNTEIWICSDLRANDWNADSGRWKTLRGAFLEFPQGVRFHLLAYPQTAKGNLSVRVTEVRRQKIADAAELVISLRIQREGGGDEKQQVPIQFEVDGARSELTIEMAAASFDLKDHRIPLEKTHERGWGRVSIPADANPADNDYWFAFDQPAPRQTVIVADDAQAARPLQLASEITPDPALKCSAEVIEADQLGSVEWEKVSLLLWQAPLPSGDDAKTVKDFVDRGGYVVFFPPRTPGDAEFLGVRWTTWTAPKEDVVVESWRGDQDLLANSQSGAALPVGQLQVKKWCGLEGETTTLATLKSGAPLLTRVTTNLGAAYFCATTPAPGDSSLATNGVVLYVAIQRALAGGAVVLGNTRQLIAGQVRGEDPAKWNKIAGSNDVISPDYALQAGVYASGDRLLAVNRSAAEDTAAVLADSRVAELFQRLDYSRVDDEAGNYRSLVQEIWRAFLVCMMAAMVAEAALCLPKPVRPTLGVTP
jgi:hypothetical protein